MQEATDRVAARFATHASLLVDYVNGPRRVTGVPATVGRTPYEMEEGGVLISRELRDYIFATSAFIDDDTGQAIVPENGGIITERDSEKVYTVSAPKGLNIYETIGPSGSVLKVHTKA